MTTPTHQDQDAEQVLSAIAEQIRGNGKARIFASPLARRLARAQGIDLA
ncbi:MAG: E3 binding domain-containing protein, partial [Methyloceanibacter sp.]